MYKFMRFFNQNRKQIIKVIVIILSVIIFIQLINSFVKKKSEEEINKQIENPTTSSNNNVKNSGLISEKSAVTGKNLSANQMNSATTVINKFIAYCNEKDLENAYNLLTDECKQYMYTSLEIFTKAYYNDIFNGQKKTCTIENWVGDIYRVEINEDMLATGKYSNENVKQDYMTIKKVNDEYKLNINSYIGYSKIGKTTTKNNISIEVVSQNTYRDHEEFTIKVINNTDNIIRLDNLNSPKTSYIEDNKGMKYSYYSHELTEPMITIGRGETKEVTLKYYSSYVSTKDIIYVAFDNMLLINGQRSERIQFKANI